MSGYDTDSPSDVSTAIEDNIPWCIILSGGAVMLMDELDWDWGGVSDGTVFGPREATPLDEQFMLWQAEQDEVDWWTRSEVEEQRSIAFAFRCASGNAKMIFDMLLHQFSYDVSRWQQ